MSDDPLDSLMQDSRHTRQIAALPSLLTLSNAICGFAAIYYASKAGYSPDGYRLFAVAAYLIFLAMIMDVLDGRVARRAEYVFKIDRLKVPGIEYS